MSPQFWRQGKPKSGNTRHLQSETMISFSKITTIQSGKSVTGRVKEQYTLSCWRIWLPEVPKCLGFPQGFNENFLAISIHLSSSVSYLKIGQERGYFGSNECQRFLLYCTFLCQKNVSLNSLECRLPISIEENKHHLVGEEGEGVDGMYTYLHLCMELVVWFFIWLAGWLEGGFISTHFWLGCTLSIFGKR